MKKFGKVAAIITAALTTVSMGVILSASATDYSEPKNPILNPNITNSNWSLVGDSVLNDYCRRKFTDTSIYVRNDTSYSVGINVYGRASKTGADREVYGTTFSTTQLTMPGNCTRLIRQLINEKGYSYAHIYFGGTGGYGKWSPDSEGSYPLIN